MKDVCSDLPVHHTVDHQQSMKYNEIAKNEVSKQSGSNQAGTNYHQIPLRPSGLQSKMNSSMVNQIQTLRNISSSVTRDDRPRTKGAMTAKYYDKDRPRYVHNNTA